MSNLEAPTPAGARYPWYGIRTRSNHEKVAATILECKGYQQFLPLYRSRKRWSDRVVESQKPLFPGYVFCRFDAKNRLPIMTTPGVISVLGFGEEPAPISEDEIAAVHAVLESGLAAEPCPFVREGQRVRVKQGALEGVEGIFTKKKSEWRIIVSIEMLQRSISVEIDSHTITAV